MEFIKLFDDGNNENTSQLRKALTSTSISEYKRKLTELKKIEKKLLSMESEIYGARGSIKIGMIKAKWKSDAAFIINDSARVVIVNEYLSELYGNGCVMREADIKSHIFNSPCYVFFEHRVLTTLRKLMAKNYNLLQNNYKKALKLDNARIKKQTPDRYAGGVRSGLTFDIYANLHYADYKEPEKFIKNLIANIDFISYYLMIPDNKEPLEEVYNKFTDTYEYFKRIAIMPSKGREIEKCYEILFVSGEPNFKNAKFVVDIINRELKESKEAYAKYTEYEDTKKQYLELCREVENIEKNFI